MAESVYKVLELIETSPIAWEDAALTAVRRASRTLRNLRVAEVVEQDLVIENGKVEAFRTKLKVSFKYEDEAGAQGGLTPRLAELLAELEVERFQPLAEGGLVHRPHPRREVAAIGADERLPMGPGGWW